MVNMTHGGTPSPFVVTPSSYSHMSTLDLLRVDLGHLSIQPRDI